MCPRRSRNPRSGQTTTQLSAEVSPAGAQIRVPGLTILYHGDLERVGERAFPDLGARWQLSRHQPLFSPTGDTSPRGLDDSHISRQPIHCRPGPEPDSVILDPVGSRTPLTVEGRPVETALTLGAHNLDRGVVLGLGAHVVLLLHRMDPMPDTSTPRFGMVGESPGLAQARRDILQVADLDVPVLVRGETGTGKELVARAIHEASARRDGPYVAVNMAVVPPSLAASELFGAEKGAFTGASKARAGYFKRAHRGTLFLDEVGEMGPDIQAMLLRVLETGEFQPVGGDRSQSVDVRLLSATDADLEAAIADQRFRAPVLHRLGGYVIQLPALRDRREDFGRLFIHFLRREAEALGQDHRLENGRKPWVPGSLVAELARYHWPGNVRQLRNVVRQLVIAHRGLDGMTMPPAIASMLAASESPDATDVDEADAERPLTRRSRTPREIPEAEIAATLRKHEWRLQATADALGISRAALYRLIGRSDKLRTAADLSRDELASSYERHGGDTRAMAGALEVSERALRRRLIKLGIQRR